MPQILIIDDDSIIQTVLKKALQSQGYEVAIADDGETGLALAEKLRPALIVSDWVMPGLDGLEVCRRVKANPNLSTTFFILLTAQSAVEDRIQGLDTGADDFLAKPIEINELQARVRAGLRLHLLSEDLQTQKRLLEKELSEAASYVRSLLPAPLTGEIDIDSRFIPSSQLGGDCFDYFWLDPDYLAIYLLDVSGHGLGAALPSITVLNLLRSQSLPNVNFYQPHGVLRALNEAFQMDSQHDKYFTIWYGVYNKVKRQLTYACAGHPPAVLMPGRLLAQPDQPSETCLLGMRRMPIGMMPDTVFESSRCTIPPGSLLYIFSDGIYDLPSPTGQPTWGLHPFINTLSSCADTPDLDFLLQSVRTQGGVSTFSDDLSILQIAFH
ncbi:PP2C family protein-serine/threonine phosphatase [Thermoleptolyngbya sp.]|jgi:sigma-B regulation protein RsbU (phosphoserine phosphatase)